MLVTLVTIGLIWQFGSVSYALLPLMLFIYLALVFRDPLRKVPAAPLGVISPVDGVVTAVAVADKGVLNGAAHKIIIRVNSLGTYTARCPVEGKIMDFNGRDNTGQTRAAHGLWVRTDEGDDVTLQFHGHRLGLAPLAFLGYGERVGQGQRCAYLRLTRFAEVQLPINSRVLVKVGERVSAGSDVLAKLPHS